MKPIRVVIFAKAPLAGFAKTRLIPALGQQGAADLAKRLLEHTLYQTLESQIGTVELCVTPSATDTVWQTMCLPSGVRLTDQGEGDLGERMARAAERVIAAGESILLIGTDCPQLDVAQLQRAALALQHTHSTLVPAFDGGYVLLGLSRFDSSVFSGIAWSTERVMGETMERLKRLDWPVETLPALHDIDEPSDLKWLPKAWLGTAIANLSSEINLHCRTAS
jgi:rSAM/selenodomain-associated transferase 1